MSAYSFAHEHDVGLNDVDRSVVLHQLAVANRYLSSLLCAFDDTPEADPEARLVAAIDRWSGKHRAPKAFGDDRRGQLVALMCDAREAALRARRLILRLRSDREGKIVGSLGSASLRLELALLVCGVETALAPRRAVDRVKLASAREQLELAVEEFRELYGARPDETGGGAMTVA